MQRAIRKGLLPCPHCGGKAGLWQAYDSSWCVQCDRCGASTMKVDRDEAVKRWNRRVGMTIKEQNALDLQRAWKRFLKEQNEKEKAKKENKKAEEKD